MTEQDSGWTSLRETKFFQYDKDTFNRTWWVYKKRHSIFAIKKVSGRWDPKAFSRDLYTKEELEDIDRIVEEINRMEGC